MKPLIFALAGLVILYLAFTVWGNLNRDKIKMIRPTPSVELKEIPQKAPIDIKEFNGKG